MVITRTPFRISFFGGGSDYPAWFEQNHGAVLSAAIDKYCYISCRYLPPFFEHRNRIVWSKIETVQSVEEIKHPVVREALKFANIDCGVEIHHDADLPARSGLGSSSSFTVGMLHALNSLKGILRTRQELAHDAIHLEQFLLRENVGCQDQVAAAVGGFNRLSFGGPSKFSVTPMTLPHEKVTEFRDHLLLFFSGIARNASEIAAEQIANIPTKRNEIATMISFVDEAISLLHREGWAEDFGALLHESWMVKRTLSSKISSSFIDSIYGTARNAGALGGKILGAGGGGFILFFAKPEHHDAIKDALSSLLFVPFNFDYSGSQTIYHHIDQSHLYLPSIKFQHSSS